MSGSTTTLAPDKAAPRRVFLGWQRPVLHSAADWILKELGSELGDVLIALPGARAARRLRELLAQRMPATGTPPRILTQGNLVDELLQLESPPAGRLTRTLVWERALEGLSKEEHARLHRRRPGSGAEDRLRLAEAVRTLHGELAPENRDFASLAHEAWDPELEAESLRWKALSSAQTRYRKLLAGLGLVDPHEGRARAIEAGRIDTTRRVVLVGIADMNHLLARLVQAMATRVTVLVGAPEELDEGFDPLGRLQASYWSERDVPLETSDWHVAEKPVDQAESVRAILGEWHGKLAADELTIGVADESVVPYLERQLLECGAHSRRAAGTRLERTRPFRLLRGLARYLRRRGFSELAALARDPDLGTALSPSLDPAGSFDAYFNEHLPHSGRDWLGERQFDKAVRGFQEDLDRGLGALAESRQRPLADWAQPIRTWLQGVYTGGLRGENENERVLAASLGRVGAALAELEEVPASLDLAKLAAAEALELLLRALRGQRVPPAPRASLPGGEGAVELVGWLDLPLDDAPALIVTGFNEGHVPESLGAHAFLPNALRSRLELPGDRERLARDVYASTVILATRSRRAFVSARRSAEGDPLVPSRIAFNRPEQELPARVLRFLPKQDEHPARISEEESGTRHACPVPPGWSAPKHLSVSAFKQYISSPYTFYLEKILGLRTGDDRLGELDPRRFGTLAHAVLQDFGERGPHSSSDPAQVARFLVEALKTRAATEFGSAALPAVGLQLELLEHRLRTFALHQAERAGEGWRIHAVEWKPTRPVMLDVDGEALEIRGKIDRIDRHPDGRWAILDYKTGDKQQRPQEAHRKKNGKWIDLQLPLYHLVAQELGLSGEPELGYGWVGRDEASTGFFIDRFEPDELAQALDTARDVVRAVRAGEFDLPGRLPFDEIFKAILGKSTLGVEPEEAAE